MDDMPLGLARQTSYAKLSPEDLQSMGKRASAAYLCDGVSLNCSIVKLAQEHPSISPHQVRRVVEYANTETFQSLFEKQAGDKNIEFPLADPGVILRDLNDGARPQIMAPPPSEYGRDPVKNASVNVRADVKLAQAFGRTIDWDTRALSEDLTKEAMDYAQTGGKYADLVIKDLNKMTSPGAIKSASQNHYPESDPFRDLFAAKQKMAKAVEDLQGARDHNRYLLKEAAINLQNTVRQHLLDENSFGEAVHAIGSVPSHSTTQKIAMQCIADDLQRRGVNFVELQANAAQYEMEKGASYRVVNPEHPVVQAYAAFAKVAEVSGDLETKLKEAQGLYDEVNGTVQEVVRNHAAQS